MPNRGTPPLTAFDRGRLKDLQKALSMGMDPSFAGSEISSILGAAQERVAQRQAQMAPLTDALLQQAASGAPASAATALTDAYSTLNPGLQRPKAQATLGAFNEALYPQGGTSPLYAPPASESTAPTALDPEDLAGIDSLLAPMIGGISPQTGQPYGLHEATMEIMSRFRALQYPEPLIQQAKAYVEQRWMAMGGPARPGV